MGLWLGARVCRKDTLEQERKHQKELRIHYPGLQSSGTLS